MGKATLKNVAMAVVFAATVTVHGPVPTHPTPFHPLNVEPGAGVAVSVTVEPLRTDCEQVAPQLMPLGTDVTVPNPTPFLVTESVNVGRWKLAPSVTSPVIVITHVPVPLQPPPVQPLKIEYIAGVAESVTTVPWANEALQVPPQLMPDGSEITPPPPLPVLMTPSVYWLIVNAAVTSVAEVIVTVHAPVPLQPPPVHPANVDPVAAVAVSVTAVPWS
jgi:hypothetical protein